MTRFKFSSFIIRSLSVLILSAVCHGSAHAAKTPLDDLFFLLKHTSDETIAKAIEKQIWSSWMESGDSGVDNMMQEALIKRQSLDFNGAIMILNRVITVKPDFSEAWNQRATIYFYQKRYEESLEDIAKTLELEPRHFGSLAGRAAIRMHQKKPSLAQQNIIEALKIHPFLRARTMFPGLQKS